MAVIRNKGNYISNDRFGLKEINSYARFILFFFIGYASDRQESGRVVLPLNVLALK